MAEWKEDFIKVNKYSRPGLKLHSVKKILLHYTANNGASAANHQRYFNNLTGRYASAHLFVDKIESILILPLDEVAYHCNDVQKYVNGVPYRGVKELLPNGNFESIGVELCLEKDGTFHKDTIAHGVHVFADLCKMYNLNPMTDIVRHYDHTAKYCPAPFVKNPEEFIAFKMAVKALLDGEKPVSKPSAIKKAVKKVIKKVQPKPKMEGIALPSGVLKLGSKGNGVKQLQSALNAAGFRLKGKVDGSFGPDTLQALKRFQSVHCNPSDGIYGAKTKAALQKVLSK